MCPIEVEFFSDSAANIKTKLMDGDLIGDHFDFSYLFFRVANYEGFDMFVSVLEPNRFNAIASATYNV